MAHLAHLAHRLDRTSRGSALVASLLAVAVVSLATSGFAGDSKDAGPCDPSSEPWIYPTEAVDTTDPVSWARFAWDGFVALNWPQLEGGAPGEPDTSVTICDEPNGRPAFLQWMQKGQLLLPDGASPGTWDDPTFSTPMFTPEDGGPTLPLLGALSKTTGPNLVDEFNEAFSHRPLLDQNGRYVLFQIFLNRSEFEYISQNGYYDAANQYAAFQPGGEFVGFPATGQPADFDPPIDLPEWAQQGAIELKASWKQLDEAEIASGRFFMQDVYYASNLSRSESPCGPVTVGLVGLHVLQLTPSTGATWFWATFEQVDNVDILPGNPNGAPSFNPGSDPDVDCPPPYENGYACNGPECTPSDPGGTTDCPPYAPESGPLSTVCDAEPSRAVNVSRIPEMVTPDDVESVNDEYRAQLPAPWKYYRLLNTIQPDPAGPSCIPPNEMNTVNTAYMTNVTMETYTQYYQFISLPKCDGTDISPMSMNCTDCHSVAKPLGAPTVRYEGVDFPDPEYQIFSFMLNNAKNSCSADLNHDRVVDSADLGILIANWGSSQSRDQLDGDAPVNGGDIGILIADWGACPDSAPLAPPEDESGFERLARSIGR